MLTTREDLIDFDVLICRGSGFIIDIRKGHEAKVDLKVGRSVKKLGERCYKVTAKAWKEIKDKYYFKFE